MIDLCHGVPPQDVRTGARRLARALPFAPAGVHLAVVDPGSAARRRAVALRTAAEDRLLVGPDNGLLIPAAERFGGVAEAVEIARSPWRLEPVSATFHGRDLFAPVAAALALGERSPTRRAARSDGARPARRAPVPGGGSAGHPRDGGRRLRQPAARRRARRPRPARWRTVRRPDEPWPLRAHVRRRRARRAAALRGRRRRRWRWRSTAASAAALLGLARRRRGPPASVVTPLGAPAAAPPRDRLDQRSGRASSPTRARRTARSSPPASRPPGRGRQGRDVGHAARRRSLLSLVLREFDACCRCAPGSPSPTSPAPPRG